jgi:ribosomal protein L37E
LKKLAGKCGIIKRVNNHAFRHASATFKAKYLPEALLRQYYGWSRNSDMANFYVHISAKDLDESVVKMHKSNGLQDKPIINVKECFKCKQSNDTISKYCNRCGFPLDEKIFFQMDKIEELLIEYFKILGEIYPPAKPKLVELAKEKGLESLLNINDDVP